MMTKKINIGVLGCANIAQRMVIPAIQSMEEFNLVAVASRSAEQAAEFSSKFGCEPVVGYDTLLDRDDVDAVYIPLPTGMHVEWAIRAMEKGKHCLIEKPIASSLVSAQRIVKVSSWRKTSLFENFMFLYHSQHQFIRQQLDAGVIGEIRCFRSAFGFPPLPADNIRYEKKLGGGVLLDAGVYTLRAAQLILGNRLSVRAAHLKIDPKSGVDIYGGVFLSGDNGITAQLAFGFDNFYQCNYEIWGSKGKITAERAFTAGPGVTPKVIIETQGDRQEHILPEDNHFANLLKDFHKSITTGKHDAQHNAIVNQARLLNRVRTIAGKRK